MKTKRFLAGFLSFIMCISNLYMFNLKVKAEDNFIKPLANEQTLINVAKNSTITVPSSQSGREATNMVDGNLSTLWVNNGNKWPCDVLFALPGKRKIKKIEIDFEKIDGRKVDINLSYTQDAASVSSLFNNENSKDTTVSAQAVNENTKALINTSVQAININEKSTKAASDFIELDLKQGQSFKDTYVYTLDTEIEMSNLKITLSNPNPSSLWPAIAEVRIWSVPEEDAEGLINIAAGFGIKVKDGNASVANMVDGDETTRWAGGSGTWPSNIEFDGSENYLVKKVELSFEKTEPTRKIDISLKSTSNNNTSNYTEFASKQGHLFGDIYSYEADTPISMSDLKIILDNPQPNTMWPAIYEVKIWASTESGGEVEKLIDVAPGSEITVPSEQKPATNMIDGNLNTLWVNNGATWPCDVVFKLPGNIPVKKVEIDFEKVEGRSVNLTISRAVNGVTSDYQKLDEKTAFSFTDTYVYEPEDVQQMTHLKINLNKPNPTTLWPAIAEVRIFMLDENKPLESYTNISNKADIVSVSGIYNESQKVNLADNNYDTVYDYFNGNFSNISAENPAWVDLNFGANQQVKGFEIAFKKPETGSNISFTYDVLGKTEGGTWTTYFKDQTITTSQELYKKQHEFQYLTGMSDVRISIKSCTGQPVISEFKIFGEYMAPIEDLESIAWKKAIHGNFSAATAYLANDGNKETTWEAGMYPAYLDIDLGENYGLSEVQIYTPQEGYEQYKIYTSIDGRDFNKLAEKISTDSCTENGEIYNNFTKNATARYLRLYVDYNSASQKVKVNEIRVLGTKSDVPKQDTPEINVKPYNNTVIDYNDTIDEVKGIIRRNIGADYINWFSFSIEEQANGYDYFTLSDDSGKVKITGNNGVSLAMGLNHYLKYFCNVNISQVGSQTKMPSAVVAVQTPVHKETKFKTRYAYNYCTHSYSMSFWGEEEWTKEIDWLALNGVNLVLDITGQEEVWRRFLNKVGYTNQEAKDFIAGPAYYAWAYMANLTGFGGPIHDSWLEERTELGRKNQLKMRKLGMEPILQAYSGMVPVDLATKDADAEIIPQSTWCSFQRPYMLKTDTPTYDKYAKLFYEAQAEVFGNNSKYYATDPFHEGGNTGGMSPATVSNEILNSLLEYKSDAVWVIQSWQGNPSNALLEGLYSGQDRRDNAIILDLYAEKTPNWNSYGVDRDGDGLKEFSDTPWVFCMLNNFGGRMGLHGHLDNIATKIADAANSAKHMKGIGITPEASQNNPLLYDFLFETIWTDNASEPLEHVDIDSWLQKYALRRYGADSQNAYKALQILSQTVYKANLNMKGQGAPESVVNARPALSIGAASTWGNAIIDYKKADLEEAARLLIKDYDTLKESDAYLYDLVDILKQLLSNTAQNVQVEMADAFTSGDLDAFNKSSEKFLAIIDAADNILSTRPEFLLGTWTTNATELAENADDFSKELYMFNSKAIVTTWASIAQCNSGGLKDYSNRQWSGLTKDYYKVRWQRWIDERRKELEGSDYESNINWFEFEWSFARGNKEYSNQPSGKDIKAIGEEILSKYTIPPTPPNPAEDDSKDVNYTKTKVTAGNEQTGEGADKAIDNDTNTIWHTNWGGAQLEEMYITIELPETMKVDGLRYLPRQSGQNGIITGYDILVSKDGTNFDSVTTGKWASNSSWKMAGFIPVEAKYVRLQATSTIGDKADKFASAAEIRITAPIDKVNITTAEIELKANYSYTGSEVKPEPIVKIDKTTLIKDTDYTLSYKNNVNVGTATITITGIGNYEGSINKTFEIIDNSSSNKEDISKASVELETSYSYTGSEVKPEPIVKVGQTTLTKNIDYTLSYKGNVNAGTATITITGIGNYSGKLEKNFIIVGKSINNCIITMDSSYFYTGNAIIPELVVKDNEIILVNNKDYTLEYENNMEIGTAKVTITGIGNYSDKVSKNFQIVKKNNNTGSNNSSGSSGGGSSLSSASKTSTIKDNTKENKNNQSVINPTGIVTNEIANVAVSDADVDKLIEDAVKNNSNNIIISPEIKDTAKKIEVKFSTDVVSNIYNKTDADIKIKTDIAEVTISKDSLPSISEKGNNVVVSLEENIKSSDLSIMIKCDDEIINNINGGVVVTVTQTDIKPGMVAMIVKSDKTEEIIKKSSIGSSSINIPLNGSADIKIKDNGKEFTDINTHWAKDSIDFTSARELFGGVSENEFSPNSNMTRAMLVSVFYRLEGMPENKTNNTFNDIKSDKYYSNAVSWAAFNGIVNGISNDEFGPDNSVTREQLAQIIYQYEKYLNVDVSEKKDISKFKDSNEVSSWAVEAMSYSVGSGLISGKENNVLDPKGTATRAEVAAIFYRLINK